MGISIFQKQKELLEIADDPSIIELLLGGSAGGPQPLDSKIYTPFGYKTMGEIQIGDQILNSDGGVSRVIDIPYRGVKPVYEITFADGSKTRAADNHIWKIKRARVKRNCPNRCHLSSYWLSTTEQIKMLVDNGEHILVPLCQPCKFTKLSKRRNIDPYILGCLIGDGGLKYSSIILTSADSEIIEYFEDNISGELVRIDKYSYRLKNCVKEREALRELGLLEKSSKEKHIPDDYLYAPLETRWELMRGLIDTDGGVDARGHLSYSSISKQLALDVQFLARSLGANATITKNRAGYKKDGVYKRCNDVYSVYIQHPNKELFCKLKRKRERSKPYNGGHIPHKRITKIEHIGDEVVQCISTSALDGLYITDDFILTHNSKTISACMIFTLTAKKYPGARFFVGRKTLKSLKQSTINTLISKVHPMFGLGYNDYKMHWGSMELEYANGSLIIFGELERQPSDPDFARLGSLEIDWAFIEEAGEITLEAKNAIKSRVGRGVLSEKYGIPGKLFLTANPSMNFLRQEYYDPYMKLGGKGFEKWQIGTDESGKPVYRGFFRMGAYDNPFLPQSYIDNLKTLPDRERKRLLEGDWNYSDEENSLFRANLIEKSITFDLPVVSDVSKFRKFIGVDVSDKGSDSTIFSLIDNGVLVAQKKSSVQMNWDVKSELPISRLIADELIEFAQRNGFTPQTSKHIAVECNGVGVGVRDMLKERGWQLTEYTATHKTRSEGYYQLMLDMDAGNIKILNSLNGLDELRKQLTAHSYEMNNQIPSVCKKEIVRNAVGHSPDEADSFMIANWCKNWISNPSNDPRRNKNRLVY